MADDKRNLAQLIIHHLRAEREQGQLDEEAVESLEISIQCIEQAYKLDEQPVQLPTTTSLLDLYNKGFSASQKKEEVSAVDKQAAEKHKCDGNDFMKVENYQQAVSAYSQAIRIDGNNAVYYCNRAAAYTAMQNFNNAISDCEEAIKIDPSYGKAYGRMGLACINAKDYQKAESAYKRAVDLEPNNTSYRQNLDLAVEKSKQEKQQQAPPAAAGPNLGGLDLSSLLSNPAVMNMAQSFMQNPQMQNMFANMMGGMPSGTPEGGQPAAAAADRPTQTQGEHTSSTASSDEAADFRNQAGINLPAGMDINQVLGATQNFAEQMRATNPELVDQLRNQFQASGGDAGGGGDTPQPPAGK